MLTTCREDISGCSTLSTSRDIRRWEINSFRLHSLHSKWGSRRCPTCSKICPFTWCHSFLPTSVRGLCECISMHNHPRPFAIQYPAHTWRRRSCAALTNSKVSRNGGLGRKFYVARFEGFWRRNSRTRAANWLPLSIRAHSGRKCGSWRAGKLCMLAKESERRLPPILA